MKLLYAFGSGMGHLSRGNALISTLGLSLNDFIIVTNSTFASQVFANSCIEYIPEEYCIDPEKLGNRIQSIIQHYKINEFYIDAFPLGLIGELNFITFNNCKLYYIARILNWDIYNQLIINCNIIFNKTLIVENLPEDQMTFIKSHTLEISQIDLLYEISTQNDRVKELVSSLINPFWLIVHSGSFEELEILWQHALEISTSLCLEPEFLIISKVTSKIQGKKLLQIDYFPASDFFPFADKIITACGFNAMNQTKDYFQKHIFIPFARKYDDQFLRARKRKDWILKNI
jgi:hypothetical protein